MSIHRKSAKFIALAAAASLALAACGDDGEDVGDAADPGDTETTTSDTGEGGTVTYAAEQEFTSYNNSTADSTAVANTLVLNGVLSGFWYFGPDGSIVRDEDFGTYEVTSEDPLTVQYTYADEAVWSDGEPIDCDDFLFEWAATSGAFPDAGFNPASTTGMEQVEKPVCEAGDKSIEITYSEPFADFESVFSGGLFPAHVIGREAGVEDVVAAIQDEDPEALAALAEFWNTGWQLTPGDIAEDITLASGPYVLAAWDPGQSVTLEPNEAYWGTPAISQVVLRTLAATGQAQALENGEIDVMDPQPNTDLIQQLESLGDAVTVQTGDEYTYEHFDPNFREGSIMSNPEVRRAFALCLPRQQILDSLIVPQNPEAVLAQSAQTFPFEEEYPETLAALEEVTAPYSTPQADIAEAASILEAEGMTGAQLRIGWAKDPDNLNQRRVDQIALITATCGEAGFEVVDAGAPTFFSEELPAGNYDVAMFAWSGSPLVTPATSIFTTGGGQNYGEYSNEEVDALFAELATTTDEAEQLEITNQIDQLLWEDLATIPVFTFPSLAAWNSNVQGVEQNPTQAGLTWNMDEWTRS